MPHGVACRQQANAPLTCQNMSENTTTTRTHPQTTRHAHRLAHTATVALVVMGLGASLGGCSALSSALSPSSDGANPSDALALVSSCAQVTAALATVSADLAAAQQGIAQASTTTDVSSFTASDVKTFTALAASANAVSAKLTPLGTGLPSAELAPDVTNLATSMTFFGSYFTLLSQKSTNLPPTSVAASSATTASTSAASIAKLCSTGK